MVNNLVFRWPKPLFFMVLGAHGRYSIAALPSTSLVGCQDTPFFVVHSSWVFAVGAPFG